jgi:hypothetical protein
MRIYEPMRLCILGRVQLSSCFLMLLFTLADGERRAGGGERKAESDLFFSPSALRYGAWLIVARR